MALMAQQNPEDQMEQAYQMAPPVSAYAGAVNPHDTLTMPLGPPIPEPPPMGPDGAPAKAEAPPTKMSAKEPAPSGKMSLLQPQEEHINNRLMADYQKDADPYGSPDNHPGFFGKFLHGLNVATGGVNRRGMEERGLQTDLQNLSKEESTENLQGSQAGHNVAETEGQNLANTAEPQKATDAHNQSVATTGNVDSETTARDQATAQGPSLVQGHAHAVNQAIAAHRDPATDPLVLQYEDAIQRLQPTKATPPGTKTVQLEVNGKPHQVLVDERTGATVKDLGESGEKPPVVNVNAQEGRQFQEQERGRGLLDKAEGAYRTAEQGANTMRDMVASARGGNKMSAQVLPLEGALAITTAQGVHRINRTEVDQYAGAGNLYDRIAGELGKVTQGQPMPPNILNDIDKLTQIQEKGAYGTYRGAFDSASHRYHLSDEKPLAEPGAGQQPQRPSNVPEGYSFNQNGPKGAGWYAPTAK